MVLLKIEEKNDRRKNTFYVRQSDMSGIRNRTESDSGDGVR